MDQPDEEEFRSLFPCIAFDMVCLSLSYAGFMWSAWIDDPQHHASSDELQLSTKIWSFALVLAMLSIVISAAIVRMIVRCTRYRVNSIHPSQDEENVTVVVIENITDNITYLPLSRSP